MLRTNQEFDVLNEKTNAESPMEEEEEGISQSEQNGVSTDLLKLANKVEDKEMTPPPLQPHPIEDDIQSTETESIILPPNELKTLVVKPELNKSDSKLFKDELKESRPISTEGHNKNDSANSSNTSLHALRHSRSFDSGLPMSPEVRRRLKAISQRSPSEISLLERKRNSLNSALSASTTTPSPGRQSIEDLASSVENLREKLSPRNITQKIVGNMYHIGFL